MPKLSERGIAHLLLLLLLGLGLIAGVYLIQKGPLNFLPKASLSKPTGPETSFTLVGPTGCTAGILCALYGQHAPAEEFAVKLYARSDIETANLFTAKMNFPEDLVEVKELQTTNSFVKNWVENFYDNNTGDISLVGGVPAPGYQTQVGGESALMATIIFRAKSIGKGTVVFTDASEILSNLNNINILTIKRPYDISVEVKPSPTPVPTPTAKPAGSRVFVTNTSYSGSLGGLTGADAKCQASADSAKLGGTWKAWLSDGTTSVDSRLIHDTGPYKLLDGTIVANSWSDLTDGSLQNAIRITETGRPVMQPAIAWTNTDYRGISFGGANNCSNFTSSTGAVYAFGMPGSTSAWWTQMSGQINCANPYSLYCFEQSSSTPPPTPSGFSCDVNGDGVKDTKDGDLIKSCWNKPATGSCTAVDVDKDGIITTDDIQKFSYNCPEIFAPTCLPRPACLDAKPPCLLTPPLEGGWCPPGPSPTPVTKPKGDGNNDGKINLVDMSVIHTDWMKKREQTTFRAGIDMNDDGLINSFDFSAHRDLLAKLGVIKTR